MLSQAFNRSTAIRRNSFGYRPTRLFLATCSAFPCKVCPIRVSQVKGAVQAMETRSQLLYTEAHSSRGEVLEWPNRAAC